jgi:hypothetical protein
MMKKICYDGKEDFQDIFSMELKDLWHFQHNEALVVHSKLSLQKYTQPMKKFKFTINGNNYEVEILGFEDNIAKVEVNGTMYDVEVQKDLKVPKTPTLVRAEAPKPSLKETKIPKNIIRTTNVAIKAPLARNHHYKFLLKQVIK